jgi:hypothetical protein
MKLLQQRIEELQSDLNRGGPSLADEGTIKDLIHAYNLRGTVLTTLFKQAAHFRRLWRHEPINSNKLGTLLTFIRKSSYAAMKMRKFGAK